MTRYDIAFGILQITLLFSGGFGWYIGMTYWWFLMTLAISGLIIWPFINDRNIYKKSQCNG